jgi:hypothetical protein
MFKEDSLAFVQDRLRHHYVGTGREALRQRPRVTRRVVAELGKGEGRTFERVDATVEVRCARGSLWITHDGDPKDVILAPGDSYRAERRDAMHVFAMQPAAFEIEFEDEVTAAH